MDVAVVEVPVGTAQAAPWAVEWSAVWVGTLGALAGALVISLVAIAVGAYDPALGGRLVRAELGFAELVASLAAAFFSFVVGGWLASRIAGLRHAEPAMLHGAVVWLLTLPILVLLIGLGAGVYFGAWYGGLAAPGAVPPVEADPEAAEAARQAALGALTALLTGLVGAVLGGWLGSGEPMRLDRSRWQASPAADVGGRA
jgi:hypothetical protein